MLDLVGAMSDQGEKSASKHPLFFLNSLMGVLFGTMSGIAMVFPGVAFGPFGVPVVPFLGIIGLTVAVILVRVRPIWLGKEIQRLVVIYFAFVSVYALMFILSGSTTVTDIHFIISTASNILWIIFLLILAKKVPYVFSSFARGVCLGFATLVIVIWCREALRYMDPFFPRYDIPDIGLLSSSVFGNPNILARSSGTILPLFYFLHISTVAKKKHDWLVVFYIIALVSIVISTLSRANFLAVLIFFVGVGSYRRIMLGKSLKIKWKRTVVVAIMLSSILTVSTTVRDRLFSLYEMAKITYNIVSAGIDVRLLPIRIRTWYASLNAIAEKPITGIGYSHIAQYQQKFGGVKYLAGGGIEPISVHGGFLKIAACGGLISLGFFIFFYYRYYRFAKREFRSSMQYSNKQQAAYCLCLLFIMLVPMNIGADCFGDPLTWLVIGILTGYVFLKKRVLRLNINFA